MITQLKPTELASFVASQGRAGEIDLVDVRDADEWDAGHIAGSRLVPLAELRADPDAALTHAPAIVFICAKGVRSLEAAKLAERFGYAHVYALDGGVKEWARAGQALETRAHAIAA